MSLDNKFKAKKKYFWKLFELGAELTTEKTFVFVEPVWFVFLKSLLLTSKQILFVSAIGQYFRITIITKLCTLTVVGSSYIKRPIGIFFSLKQLSANNSSNEIN